MTDATYDIAPEADIAMQFRMSGVSATSFFLFLCAASAPSCTTEPASDLFGPPSSSHPSPEDASSKPSDDAAPTDDAQPPQPGVDAAQPPPTPMADANSNGSPMAEASLPESSTPPSIDAGPVDKNDAAPVDKSDATVIVPQDSGGGMIVIDAQPPPIDVGFPTLDATPPIEAGNVDTVCLNLHGILFRGHCYFTIASAQWDENACASQGAHLATLTSQEEQVAAAAAGVGQERWIGLRRRNGPPKMASSFQWVTGEPLSYMNWAMYNGSTDEPNGSGDCVRLLAAGTWADEDCSNRFAVLCERE